MRGWVTKRSLRRELKRQAGSATAFHRAWQTERALSNSLFAQLSEAHREITTLKAAQSAAFQPKENETGE